MRFMDTSSGVGDHVHNSLVIAQTYVRRNAVIGVVDIPSAWLAAQDFLGGLPLPDSSLLAANARTSTLPISTSLCLSSSLSRCNSSPLLQDSGWTCRTPASIRSGMSGGVDTPSTVEDHPNTKRCEAVAYLPVMRKQEFPAWLAVHLPVWLAKLPISRTPSGLTPASQISWTVSSISRVWAVQMSCTHEGSFAIARSPCPFRILAKRFSEGSYR